ncbi:MULTISPECIES: acyl-CoA carboxylase subunit beta [Streptomyces]|uniref:Acetyl-coenzyme A carboxyl transferase alpha chain or Acetyl-coenzyme A carboxyl transferase beta chain Propionyl-CoA carboxylase beta chain n=4 Tax=Streptomyces venezuelae TaxID=54571 RepID=F2RC26_STRVP|nr:acyl-CoA carboxylase subunit beta [Streptomyces venezuelae]APE24781.1 methylmalonyl-CoA carboxyltransferase [Streptomyces venezuelae]QES02129.1 acyl-CoA carboxylase subunit beta [Streptomyces venezuelae ATCC 10712]QES09110.1 acyl-CoA carboxylase subunit beta [Streptomyces venezuelae]CCA59277.1 acetyl-coenzyme A carboxyl transferase alpha chain or Acetyl-coenzyme A carboxyl transferase beta chain; Propionyl-CoA carboxylase beta chain [Streptomyces venezuelae ATCC 10712]
MTTTSTAGGALADRLTELGRLRELAQEGPDPKATERQHAKGKLTARERIELLLDKGSFTEIEQLRRHRAQGFGLEAKKPYTDGVITGWGTVEGRTVFVYAHDFRIFGGALGEAHATKIHKIMDMAIAAGAPLVSLNDGAGARIQEGVSALAGYGGIFQRNTRASGVIPQISVMLGPCAGGAAYSPALTDFVFMVRETSQMFITGPDVVKAVTGEEITQNGLGGADVHAGVSGVSHFVYDDEETCLAEVRYLLSMLPQNNRDLPPVMPSSDPADRPGDRLLDLVPADGNRSYDVREVIEELVDDSDYMEVHAAWAPNLVCAFARLDGHVVGIVANQPAAMAGVLDIKASEKGARFVQFCDAFNIPIITLVDVPGFLPGVDQEHDGIIRRGAKLLYAYCNATVPRISVVLRKAYGGAYIVMDSRSIGADISLAWPTNEIAVMGAEGAANVVFRREIAAADDPEAMRAQKIQEYREELVHPYYAAERGLVDDVIDPRETRQVLCRSVAMLAAKHADLPRRKHGNPPQ